MSLLKYIDERMVDDEQEDFIWNEWREMNRVGIISYSDDEIRSLHARFSLLLSEAELNFANFDGAHDVKKLQKELKEAVLVVEHYSDGAMNQRTAQAKADKRYQDLVTEMQNYLKERALWKGRVAATQTAVECLSREISYRIKK